MSLETGNVELLLIAKRSAFIKCHGSDRSIIALYRANRGDWLDI